MDNKFTEWVGRQIEDVVGSIGCDEKDLSVFTERFKKGAETYGTANFLDDKGTWQGKQEIIEEIVDAINVTVLQEIKNPNSAEKACGLEHSSAVIGHLLHSYSVLTDMVHPLVVYISHPFSNDPDGNTAKVQQIAATIFSRGHIPLAVHTMYNGIDLLNPDLDYDTLMEACLHLLMQADVMLFCGVSKGTLIEFMLARRILKPIIYDVGELPIVKRWKKILQSNQ